MKVPTDTNTDFHEVFRSEQTENIEILCKF